MSTTGPPREPNRLARTLLVVVAGLTVSCGADFGVLVSVRCTRPACELSIPFDINYLSIELTQPAHSPPPLTREYNLERGDTFPLTVSVMAGADAQPGEVVCTAEVRSGGQSGISRASGRGSTDLLEDAQTELIVELTEP